MAICSRSRPRPHRVLRDCVDQSVHKPTSRVGCEALELNTDTKGGESVEGSVLQLIWTEPRLPVRQPQPLLLGKTLPQNPLAQVGQVPPPSTVGEDRGRKGCHPLAWGVSFRRREATRGVEGHGSAPERSSRPRQRIPKSRRSLRPSLRMPTPALTTRSSSSNDMSRVGTQCIALSCSTRLTFWTLSWTVAVCLGASPATISTFHSICRKVEF